MAQGQGKRISDEIRAQVIAALLQGQAVTEVAKEYRLPKSSVSRLKNEIPHTELEQVGTKKRLDIAENISNFLDEGFKAIINTLKVTENVSWLNSQPASELATFIGVTSDKLFRILEAIENANRNKETDKP